MSQIASWNTWNKPAQLCRGD